MSSYAPWIVLATLTTVWEWHERKKIKAALREFFEWKDKQPTSKPPTPKKPALPNKVPK